MIMVKAYKSIEFFLLYINILALEDILLLIVDDRILTNVIYDHDLLMLSCLYIFVEFLLRGQQVKHIGII
jgi:hypothetical protein